MTDSAAPSFSARPGRDDLLPMENACGIVAGESAGLVLEALFSEIGCGTTAAACLSEDAGDCNDFKMSAKGMCWTLSTCCTLFVGVDGTSVKVLVMVMGSRGRGKGGGGVYRIEIQ